MASFASRLNLYSRNDTSGCDPAGYLLSYPTAPPCAKDTRCVRDQKQGQIAVAPAKTRAESRDESPARGTSLHPRKIHPPEPHTTEKFLKDLGGKPLLGRTIYAVRARHYGSPCRPNG